MSSLKPIRRALLSVTDKSGLVELARGLSELGVELVSTGGTAVELRGAGLAVRDVAELTGFPEMLDGRVKTLHPAVHGGILHRREDAAHVAAVAAQGIGAIDLVVVNLYAFEKTAATPGVGLEELIEKIDIGGPSMLRSAAKNCGDVAVVCDPAEYGPVLEELRAEGGQLSWETRWRLARRAFAVTAGYDGAIAAELERRAAAGAGGEGAGASGEDAGVAKDGKDGKDGKGAGLPAVLSVRLGQSAVLRYGENPHQAAALYADGSGLGVANAEQLNGKELSYNNLVDVDACWALAEEFAGEQVCTAVIVKHTNPCGVGQGATAAEAFERALAADPVSAFGGILAVTGAVDGDAARAMARLFVEAVVAREFTDEALEVLRAKKNLRVLRIRPTGAGAVVKQISGGYLVQTADEHELAAGELVCPTVRRPSEAELRALRFSWKVCKHVKSNAIVYARVEDGFGQTVGVGAGQMSRVDAARFGAMKAALPLAGTVAASDAYFPFADGLEVVAEAGATAVIQPGGSVRDAEVVAAADRLGMAMVMTGVRHFRHG